jgi:hypothetical protein
MFKNKIVSLFLLSLWVTILHGLLVVDFRSEHPLFQYKKSFLPASSQVECGLDLEPDHYLLKIKHKVQTGQSKRVIFNGEAISTFKVLEKKRKEIDYFHISPKQIRENNSLKIDFAPGFPEEVKIKLQNYRHTFIADNVIAFFRPSLAHLVKFSPLQIITVFLLSSLFFVAVVFGSGKNYRKKFMRVFFILGLLLTSVVISNFLPFTSYIIFISPFFFLSCYVLIAFVALVQVVLHKHKTGVVPFQPTDIGYIKQKMPAGLFIKFFLLGILVLVTLNFSCLDLPFAYADDWHYLQTEREGFDQAQVQCTWAEGKPLTGLLIGLSNMLVDDLADLAYLRFFSILSLAISMALFAIWLKSLHFQNSTAFMISAALIMVPGATNHLILGVQGTQYPAMPISLLSAILCERVTSQIIAAPLFHRTRMFLLYSVKPFLLLVVACLIYQPYAMYYLIPAASMLLFKKESWKTLRIRVIHSLTVFICALPAYFCLHRYVLLPLYLLINPGFKNHPFYLDTTGAHSFYLTTSISSLVGKIRILLSENIWSSLDLWINSHFPIQTSSGTLWNPFNTSKIPGILVLMCISVACVVHAVRIYKTSAGKSLCQWKFHLQRVALFCFTLLLSITLVIAPKGPTLSWGSVLAAFSIIVFLACIWAVMVFTMSTRVKHKVLSFVAMIALILSALDAKYNTSFALENFLELAYVRQEIVKHIDEKFSDIVLILPANGNPPYVSHTVRRNDRPATTAKVCSALLPVMVGHIFEQLQCDKYVQGALVKGGNTAVFVHLSRTSQTHNITMHGPMTEHNPLVIDLNKLQNPGHSWNKNTVSP